MKHTAVNTREAQEGFSIVELMVSLTLSLILIGGVLSLVYSSKITYLENERVAGTQEGGRAAFEMLLRDLRGSGFPGCAQPITGLVVSNNILTNPTSLLWSLDVPMQGYDGSSGTWKPALDPLLAGATKAPSAPNDIIVIRTIRASQPQLRTTAKTNPGDDIVLAKTAGQKFVANDNIPYSFVISDCLSTTYFSAKVTTADTIATLKRNTDASVPSNQAADLLASFNPGAQVTPLDSVAYYIAPSATPAVNGGQAGPALWRIVSSNNATPEEVIPGVERMEIQYGVDTNSDGTVDEYDDANVVNTAAQWCNVVSIRIAILVRSTQPNSPDIDKKTYTLLNSTAGPFNDKYERSLYTTTIALRNRIT